MTTAPHTQPAPDPNDILMGAARVPTVKFDSLGEIHGGRILAVKAHQEREYDRNNPGQGAPKYFPSGDPIYGLTIDVATNLRDPSIDNDDGTRRIYVEGKRMKDAVAAAVREAGRQRLDLGGTLEVAYTGNGEPAGPNVNPPKEYQARYAPPGPSQADVFAQQQPAAQPAAPAAAAQTSAPPPTWAQPQPTAPTPQPNGPTAEQVAAVRASGVDPAQVWPGIDLSAYPA